MTAYRHLLGHRKRPTPPASATVESDRTAADRRTDTAGPHPLDLHSDTDNATHQERARS